MRSRSSTLRYWCFTTHDRIWRNGSFRSYGEKRNSSFLTSECFQASDPKFNEVSEGDRTQGSRYDSTAPKPTEQAVTAAYQAAHDAARKKNLKGFLAALGFDA